jgi:small subunit ribosomal protein S8
VHDTIGDFLTIIRNASRAGNRACIAHLSKLRLSIAKILKDEGFIRDYRELQTAVNGKKIEILLKYIDEQPLIVGIQRHSRPGCRIYCGADKIPRVLNGLGLTIISTSKGLLKGSDARRQRAGGEIIAKVW